MTILLLTFALLFLAIFAVCLNVIKLWEERRDLDALALRQSIAKQRDNEAAWYRNRYTVMR
jgi:HAMP domain-containing protein